MDSFGITIIATALGFVLGWSLFGSKKKPRPVDQELNRVLTDDQHKVKGRFE